MRPLRVLAIFGLVWLAGCPSSRPSVTNVGAGSAPPPAAVAFNHPPAEPPAAPKFVDITQSAGIDFRHQNSATPRKYLIETMGSGCAFIDYDGDGWLDILLLNNRQIPGGKVEGRPTMKLYHNERNGRFKDVTQAAGLDKLDLYAFGVAVGDYDNDGRQDFYVTTALDGGHLFHNEGGGRFKDVTAQAGVDNAGNWGTSCAWVDYDKDGKLDLFVCNYVKYSSLKDDQPCYSGSKHELVYCVPSAYDKSHCVLYRNMGGGKFKDVTQASGIGEALGKSLGVTIWDYDGDGWPDIFVANDTVAGFLFHNEKDGTFKEVGVESGVAYNEEGVPHSGMGIDCGDPGHNGRSVLILTNYYGQQTSYYDQINPTIFRDTRVEADLGRQTAKFLGFGIFFFDWENSGLPGILQANGHVQDDIQTREPDATYAEQTLLFRNLGNGKYEEVGLNTGDPFSKKLVGRGSAWGDIENDGRLDVLLSANNGRPMLWRNETATKNHWLTLKLVGKKSNRDGIGAIVTVTAGGVTQKTMVRSALSYLSSSDLRPHFGLGTLTSADVEIAWPSGQVDRLKIVPADKITTVVEGQK